MKTVLIVEDNLTLSDFTARGLSSQLSDRNIEIVCALSCANARNMAEKTRPDVLVVDKRLPDGSGIDLARELVDELPGCRAILVSADPIEHPPRRVCATVSKPFEISELARIVGEQLHPGPVAEGQGVSETEADLRRNLDTHLIRNRLSGLLAGLRAFGYDLEADAEDPSSVREAVDFYVDRLCTSVQEICDLLEGQGKS
jgi:DNA-binding response OmpR family regulator